MTPCKFTFDDSPQFDGFAHGSKWNGFDNVAVTAAERERIVHWFRESSVSGDDDGSNGVADIMSIPGIVGSDPALYSLGWGYATQIVREPEPMPDLDPAALLIALRFVEVLAAWLEPHEWAEMRERNAVQTDKRICHSHDYCDANMAMAEAFESVTGKTPDGDNDAETKLWNSAWEHAMPILGRKA